MKMLVFIENKDINSLFSYNKISFPGNAVIPKSVTPSRIEENLKVFSFSLDAADMETMNNLYKKVGPKGYRTCNVLHWQNSPNYPFASEL